MSVWYYHCQHVSLFVEDTFDVRMDDKENKTPTQEIISNSSSQGEAIYLLVFSRSNILFWPMSVDKQTIILQYFQKRQINPVYLECTVNGVILGNGHNALLLVGKECKRVLEAYSEDQEMAEGDAVDQNLWCGLAMMQSALPITSLQVALRYNKMALKVLEILEGSR